MDKTSFNVLGWLDQLSVESWSIPKVSQLLLVLTIKSANYLGMKCEENAWNDYTNLKKTKFFTNLLLFVVNPYHFKYFYAYVHDTHKRTMTHIRSNSYVWIYLFASLLCLLLLFMVLVCVLILSSCFLHSIQVCIYTHMNHVWGKLAVIWLLATSIP